MSNEKDGKPRRVCIAVDESPFSDQAVRWASGSLLKPTDEVHLVSVVRPIPIGAETGDPGELEDAWVNPPNRRFHDADDLLNRFRKDVQSIGASKVRCERLTGDIGGAEGVGIALKEYAKKNDVDAVVLGSRGLGGVNSTFLGAFGLGSVSDYCVKHMPCPVIVHKPKDAFAEHASPRGGSWSDTTPKGPQGIAGGWSG